MPRPSLSLLLVALGAGCAGPVWDTADDTSCDVRVLAAGEIRVRRLPCDDEVPWLGEGRRYDWILENAVARYLIRQPERALTLLDGGGGTLIDAAAPQGQDVVTEVVPLVAGCWLEDNLLEVLEEGTEVGLRISGVPVDPGLGEEPSCVAGTMSVTWRLRVDDPVLELEGADGFWLLPMAGVEAEATFLVDDGWMVGVDGTFEDRGGGLRATGNRLAVGLPSDVQEALWPAGPAARGTAVAEHVACLAGDHEVGRLNVTPAASGRLGTFDGSCPAGTDGVRAVAEGRAPGPVVAPGEDLVLAVGGVGVLGVRVSDGASDRAAWLQAVSEAGEVAEAAIPPTGAHVPLGPGVYDLTLAAGPRAGRVTMARFEVRGETRLEALLPTEVDPEGWILADLDVEAWPSRRDRTAPEDALDRAIAQGAAFLVATAPDEIATATVAQPWDRGTRLESGARTEPDGAGTIWSWPWSPNDKKAAHGAPDWRDRTPEDTLALAAGASKADRRLVVDADWVRAAGAPWSWDPVPDAFRFTSPEDLPVWLGLLDQWVPLSAAGPWTWIQVEDPRTFAGVEAERGLVVGATVASTGPFLALSVEGTGPGGEVGRSGSLAVSLEVLAPPWMALDGARLVVDGEDRASWDLAGQTSPQRLLVTEEVVAERYVLAVTWGAEDPGVGGRGAPWAVTSPVWIRGPTEEGPLDRRWPAGAEAAYDPWR